jgi:hypothetical protein
VTSDAGLLPYRELDDALGLSALAGEMLADARVGRNGWHAKCWHALKFGFGRRLPVIRQAEAAECGHQNERQAKHRRLDAAGQGRQASPDAFRADKNDRAAVMQQRAQRDPLELYRQRAEKNGRKLEDVLSRVSEFEAITDPVERHRWINRAYSANDQEIGQHLYHGTSPSGSMQQAFQEQIVHAVGEFDKAHPDIPIGHPLRNRAVEILEKRDKRLDIKSATSVREVFERALSLAWQDHPQNKARMGTIKMLEDRDAARTEGLACRVQKKMATV